MADRKNERQRLLTLVGDVILAEGVSTLSLSGLARSIGSNNRMLLYYFGSKEDLLAEATLEVFRRFPRISTMTAGLIGESPLADRLVAGWLALSHPDNLPFLRLFFETFGVASHAPEQNQSLLNTMGTNWADDLTNALRRDGLSEADARMLGVQVLALWRGLQFDLVRGTPAEVLDAAHPPAIRALLAPYGK
ncbi:TetR/AcrR family transcriptional regulator [Subtercola endophyticus]|uniref:TetR/AcrR family transcriptional regulator n=1 Tax=Subtercola endophyticus TaxID=2895559 RepID=UPI001E573AF0|nr:TetR/AcrR family transcriptional regulator [Subtercola endophyticus]UFS60814.1 TetR/AcrR family transcriptional regulator [Subtercola endophyticus]